MPKVYHRAREPAATGRVRSFLAGAALMLVAITACDRAPSNPVVTDTAIPQRVLLIEPELGELLAEFGLGAQVVGTDSLTHVLPAFAHALDLGPPCAIDAGKAQALEPDLSLVLGSTCGREAARLLAEYGLAVRLLEPGDINEVVTLWHQIGRLFGMEARAREVAAGLTRDISRVATARDGLSRRRVAWIVQRDPLVAVGATGVLHDMLELAGAENAFDEPTLDPRIPVTSEAIIGHHPDLVIESSGADGFAPLPLPGGVATQRVPASLASVPTLAVAARIRQLHGLLYPDSPQAIDRQPPGG